jgi:hypothetical protein
MINAIPDALISEAGSLSLAPFSQTQRRLPPKNSRVKARPRLFELQAALIAGTVKRGQFSSNGADNIISRVSRVSLARASWLNIKFVANPASVTIQAFRARIWKIWN